MTSRQGAISITESFLKSSGTYHGFAVDLDNILEKETLWYVPFKELNPAPNNFLVGAFME